MNPAGWARRGHPSRPGVGDPGTNLDQSRVPGTISDPSQTPPEGRNGPGMTTGGDRRARPEHLRSGADGPQQPATAPDYGDCSICTQPIADIATGRCWRSHDPHHDGTVAAHTDCLRRIGEHELGLEP